VRDRTPAPLTGAPNDPLCDDDEDVHPFKRRPCPHELWLALDLDANGDGTEILRGKLDRLRPIHAEGILARIREFFSFPSSSCQPNQNCCAFLMMVMMMV
jgi:hypothetical protein